MLLPCDAVIELCIATSFVIFSANMDSGQLEGTSIDVRKQALTVI